MSAPESKLYCCARYRFEQIIALTSRGCSRGACIVARHQFKQVVASPSRMRASRTCTVVLGVASSEASGRYCACTLPTSQTYSAVAHFSRSVAECQMLRTCPICTPRSSSAVGCLVIASWHDRFAIEARCCSLDSVVRNFWYPHRLACFAPCSLAHHSPLIFFLDARFAVR